MRDGQAGLGHPPWRGGGGVARLAECLQERVEGFKEYHLTRFNHQKTNLDPASSNPKLQLPGFGFSGCQGGGFRV